MKIDVERNFAQIVPALIDDKKITRKEWNNEGIFGQIKDERLRIFTADNRWHTWEVSLADLEAEDWYIIN